MTLIEGIAQSARTLGIDEGSAMLIASAALWGDDKQRIVLDRFREIMQEHKQKSEQAK